jgi:hypothetical protein
MAEDPIPIQAVERGSREGAKGWGGGAYGKAPALFFFAVSRLRVRFLIHSS